MGEGAGAWGREFEISLDESITLGRLRLLHESMSLSLKWEQIVLKIIFILGDPMRQDM